MELAVHPRLGDVDAAAWDGLLDADAPAFLRHAFLDAFERTGCVGDDTGWVPHHFTFHEHGRLVAAAPAYLKLHSDGEFVFDHAIAGLAQRLGLPYYPKLLVAVPFTPATAPRLLVAPGQDRARLHRALAAGAAQVVERLELSSAHVLFPPADDAGLLEEAGLLPRHGIQFHWSNPGYPDFEAFLRTLPSKMRTQIRRERRALGEAGVRLETLRGDRLTPQVADAMFGFYLATVDKFVWGRRYLTRAFFETVLAEQRDAVEVVFAYEGPRPIAGAFNVATATTLFGRYWGLDPAVAARPRPPPFLHFNVCYYHSIEECIALGRRRFEPGAGGGHKRSRGFIPAITHSAHHFAAPRLRGLVAAYFERERAAVADEVSGTEQED